MTTTTRQMIEVLQRREHKCRLALAGAMQRVAASEAEIRAMDRLLAEMQARVTVAFGARAGAGRRRPIPECLDEDRQIQNLLAGRDRVVDLRRQCETKRVELDEKRGICAREWRRAEAALSHAKTLARRALLARALAATELDDQMHADARAALEKGNEDSHRRAT